MPRPHPTVVRIAPALVALLLAPACRRDAPPADRAVAPAAAAPVPRVPEDAISHLNVGVRRLELFQYAEAIASFEAALAVHPRWTPALADLAIAHLNALEPEHAERAVAVARQALAASPRDPRITYVLAYALAERQRAFGEALPLLRQVVAAEPHDAFAWYELGRSAHELAAEQAEADSKLHAEAEAAYRRALALDARFVEANYKLGRLLLESSDAARQAEGERILAGHEELVRGRPSVQQNYLRRGDLALAYPYTPPRGAPPAPTALTLRLGPRFVVPPFHDAPEPSGMSPSRYRDGVTVADLDGDGLADLLAPMRQPAQPALLLWRHEGPHAFAAPVAFGPRGEACGSAPLGDLDRDGDLDAVVTCSGGTRLFQNHGGLLVDATEGSGLGGAEDAALAATLVDFDHDGDLDVHALTPLEQRQGSRWESRQLAYRNDGTGRFVEVAAEMGLDVPLDSDRVLWTDVDGDNAIDLVGSVSGGGLAVLRNDRRGRHAPVLLGLREPVTAGPPTIALGSLDLDGDLDLDLVTSRLGKIRVLRNDSRPARISFVDLGVFDAGGPPPGALLAADLDLDGVAEVVTWGSAATGTTGGAARLTRLGDAPGAPSIVLRQAGCDDCDGTQVAAADLDGDGDLDLVSRVPRTGEPAVLWNDLPEGRAWVAVRLQGREARSNPQGFGAKVTVDAGSLRQHVEVASSTGYLSHAVAPVVVGIGARATLDGVSVMWPSGIRQAELEVPLRAVIPLVELDRQPSSCPMLYGWDGEQFRFLTDCFDTAPVGLWVAPGVHWPGDPEEVLRLRPGWVTPEDGVLTLSIAEFLNESLLADAVRLLAVDDDDGRSVVVDEAVRLLAPPQPSRAWSLRRPVAPARALLHGRDVTTALAAEDRRVAGYVRATRFMGLAEPFTLDLDLPTGRGVLVLTGSLNFGNSSNLFAAQQAGVRPMPPRLEVEESGAWREVMADIGAPAGFHKDVVADLRDALPDGPAKLRITTNLQVSWDRVALYTDAAVLHGDAVVEVPVVRAEKAWLGIPREVKGPENRWREFPREGLAGASDWVAQDLPRTPDGDVSALLSAVDGRVAVVQPGEELLMGFDAAALPPPADGRQRTYVLATHGWVADADPHTAPPAELIGPLPR